MMPRLILQREPFRREHPPTQGMFLFAEAGRGISLRIDSLELRWAGNQPKISCIPPGTYPMRWTFSPKFNRETWELIDVPDRSAIRIHSGNFAGEKITDSLGCIMPCLSWADINADGVIDGLSSRIATRQLEAVLKPYQEEGIAIEVLNG